MELKEKEKTHMRSSIWMVSAALLLTVSCAGPRAFTKGTYEDPEVIALL